MSKSPNSQDSADNGLSFGKLCKIWQTAKKTHITCGYTKELPECPQIWVQIRNCTTKQGILRTVLCRQKDLVPKLDHSVVFWNRRFLNHVLIRNRKVWRQYKRVEKTINTTHWTRNRGILNRYIFLTRIQKLSVYLSQCKSQKMIFC